LEGKKLTLFYHETGTKERSSRHRAPIHSPTTVTTAGKVPPEN